MYGCIQPSLNSEENFRRTLQFNTGLMCHLCFRHASHLVGLIDIFREKPVKRSEWKRIEKTQLRYQAFAWNHYLDNYNYLFDFGRKSSAQVLKTMFCVEDASVQLSIFVFDIMYLFSQLCCLISRRLTWLTRLLTWSEAQIVLEDQYSRLPMSFYNPTHALADERETMSERKTEHFSHWYMMCEVYCIVP